MPFVKHTWNKSNKHCPNCGSMNGQDFIFFTNSKDYAKCFDCEWVGKVFHVNHYCPKCGCSKKIGIGEDGIKCYNCKWEGKANEFFQSKEEFINHQRSEKLKEILNDNR